MKSTSLIFAASALLISGTCFASVNLAQFNHVNQTWQTYHVQGIDNIDRLATTGQYAWLLDMNKQLIVFFDGSKWRQAQSAGNLQHINNLYQAFRNRDVPVVWAQGAGVAVFNGLNWATYPDLFADKLMVAGGNAWIKPLSPTIPSYFLHANYQYPMQLDKIDYSVTHKNAAVVAYNTTGNDANPAFFVVYAEGNQNYKYNHVYISKYSPDGSEKIVFSKENEFSIATNFSIGGNQDEIVLFALDPNNGASVWYSRDNGSNWSKHATLFNQNFYTSTIVNGNLCGSYTQANELGYAFCQNLNSQNDSPVIYNYHDVARGNRITQTAFVTPLNFSVGVYYPANPVLLSFNYQTGLRTDLKPNDVAQTLSDIRALPGNHFIACGIDKTSHRSAIFYNDGSAWTSSPSSLSGTNCGFNTAGGYDQFYMSSSPLWLYERTGGDTSSVH